MRCDVLTEMELRDWQLSAQRAVWCRTAHVGE